jgi:hypothetical protein
VARTRKLSGSTASFTLANLPAKIPTSKQAPSIAFGLNNSNLFLNADLAFVVVSTLLKLLLQDNDLLLEQLLLLLNLLALLDNVLLNALNLDFNLLALLGCRASSAADLEANQAAAKIAHAALGHLDGFRSFSRGSLSRRSGLSRSGSSLSRSGSSLSRRSDLSRRRSGLLLQLLLHTSLYSHALCNDLLSNLDGALAKVAVILVGALGKAASPSSQGAASHTLELGLASNALASRNSQTEPKNASV